MLHLDGRKYSPPALDFLQVDLKVGGEQTAGAAVSQCRHLFIRDRAKMTTEPCANAVERDPSYADDNLIWIDMEMTGLQPR